MEQGGSHVGQTAVLYRCVFVGGDIYAGNRVERVGRVGGAVGIDGVVGVAVVSDDDGFIAGGVGSLNYILHTFVNSLHSLFDGLVDTGVAYHVAVGEVDHDEIIFV